MEMQVFLYQGKGIVSGFCTQSEIPCMEKALACKAASMFSIEGGTMVNRYAKWIVRHRVLVILICLLSVVPAFFGITAERVRYNLFSCLPEQQESVRGQKILMDEFGKGAFSLMVTEGLTEAQEFALETRLKKVSHVDSVFGYASLTGGMLPSSLLPDAVQSAIVNGEARLMGIVFDDAASSEGVMQAVEEIRLIAGEQCFLSGLAAVAVDVRKTLEEQDNVMLLIAAGACMIALVLMMDSFLLPFLFLSCIAVSLFWNLGTNFFLGEISYLTKAASAVVQIAVTLDYAVFLWPAYRQSREKRTARDDAMTEAVVRSGSCVLGSGVTTIVCFASLCLIATDLGREFGLVMIKGVFLSLLCALLLLPCLLRTLDEAIENTSHRPLLPEARTISRFILRHERFLLILSAVFFGLAVYGCTHLEIGYDLRSETDEEMPSVLAEQKLEEHFDLASAHFLIVNAEKESKEMKAIADEVGQIDGIHAVLGLHSFLDSRIPAAFLPDRLLASLRSEHHQLLIATSSVQASTDAGCAQLEKIEQILKKADPEAIVAGEGSLAKDLAELTEKDFWKMAMICVLALLLILAIGQKSLTLPLLIMAVAGFAVALNLGVMFYIHQPIPFAALFLVFAVQLGLAVDYALVLTSGYKRARGSGKPRKEAVSLAVGEAARAILASGLASFAAAMAAGLYVRVEGMAAAFRRIAWGAGSSALVVLFFMPVLLILLDRIVMMSTAGMHHRVGNGMTERRRT